MRLPPITATGRTPPLGVGIEFFAVFFAVDVSAMTCSLLVVCDRSQSGTMWACAPHHTGGLALSHEVTVPRDIQIPLVCERLDTSAHDGSLSGPGPQPDRQVP